MSRSEDRVEVAALRRLDRSEVRSRPVPRVDPDLDPERFSWPDDAPDDHRLATAGLASFVWSESEDLLGHILVLDLDDRDPAVAVEEARRLSEPAVVLRTSPGSYHVVALGVESFDDRVEEARESESCPEFVEEMNDRGRFVCRTHAKHRQTDGSVYKEDPEPVLVVGGEGRVSEPHLVRLVELANDVGRYDLASDLDDLRESNGSLGSLLTQTKYETMTDELRAVLDSRGGR